MNHPKEYSRNPLRKIRRGMWKRFCGEVLDMTTSLHPRAKPQKTFWKLARGVEYFSRRVVSGDMISTDTFIFTCIYTTCCIAHKKKSAVRTTTSNIIETGIWSMSAPQNPFGSFNTLRSFTGAVLPIEASKWLTTPGGTQPSHDIVSYVIGLALSC